MFGLALEILYTSSQRSDRIPGITCHSRHGRCDDNPFFLVSSGPNLTSEHRADIRLGDDESNLTVRTFPAGKTRNRAIAILGLIGSVSFSLGVVIGEYRDNRAGPVLSQLILLLWQFRWTFRSRILEVAVSNSVDHLRYGNRHGRPGRSTRPHDTRPLGPRNRPQNGSVWTALFCRFDPPARARLDIWPRKWLGRPQVLSGFASLYTYVLCLLHLGGVLPGRDEWNATSDCMEDAWCQGACLPQVSSLR